jgi:hypothetical protein
VAGAADDLERQCRALLRAIRLVAQRTWRRHGQRCDLSEYEDAGMEALRRCLATYDPTRGVRFQTYAEHRIRGAIQDASEGYQHWHRLRSNGRARTMTRHPHAHCLRPDEHLPTAALEQRLDLARRLDALPEDAKRYAAHILAGGNDESYAAAEGIHLPGVWRRLRLWRRMAAP